MPKPDRRRLLSGLLAGLLTGTGVPAVAQPAYPAKPLRLGRAGGVGGRAGPRTG